MRRSLARRRAGTRTRLRTARASVAPSRELRRVSGMRGGDHRTDARFLVPGSPVPASPRNTPGLTKRRKTPHAAATFGVLTELAGLRPPGPGAPQIYPDATASGRDRIRKKLHPKAELFQSRIAKVDPIYFFFGALIWTVGTL